MGSAHSLLFVFFSLFVLHIIQMATVLSPREIIFPVNSKLTWGLGCSSVEDLPSMGKVLDSTLKLC